MAQLTNSSLDNENYIKRLAGRAFRSFSKIDEHSIAKIEREFDTTRSYKPKNGIPGLSMGLALGLVVCVLGYYVGIPFSSVETTFITVQFGLLGALMTYINS